MIKCANFMTVLVVLGKLCLILRVTRSARKKLNLYERVYTKSTGSQLEDIFLNKRRTRLYTAHKLTPLTQMGTRNHQK